MQADFYVIELNEHLCETPIRITFEFLNQQTNAIKDFYKATTGEEFDKKKYEAWLNGPRLERLDWQWDFGVAYFRTLIRPLDETVKADDVIFNSTLPELQLLHLNFKRLRQIAFPQYPDLVPDNIMDYISLNFSSHLKSVTISPELSQTS